MLVAHLKAITLVSCIWFIVAMVFLYPAFVVCAILGWISYHLYRIGLSYWGR